MIIHFDEHFDTKGPLCFPSMACAEAGTHYFGPSRLLEFIELRLGIINPGYREIYRISSFKDFINQIVDGSGPSPFYAHSFEADPFGVAADLLRKRDELRLAGWDFKYQEDIPDRLRNFSEIEADSGLLSGFADRFHHVETEIASLSPVLAREILSIEKVVTHPERFQLKHVLRLFDLLKNLRIPFDVNNFKLNSTGTSDLVIFQEVLTGNVPAGKKIHFGCD